MSNNLTEGRDVTPQLLTIRDVSALLSIPERTVQRYVREGVIPSIKIRHLRRVSRQALDQWIREQEGGQTKVG